MSITESDLPGVGKKFEIDLGGGESLVVLIHNTGKREIHRRPAPDADSEKLFELSDELAQQVGAIIEGAHFQPVQTDNREATLPGGLLIEWYDLPAESPLVDETIASADIGARTGVNVVAIRRGDETIDSPTPDTALTARDTVIVTGTREECERFETLLAGDR
jgi:TrkA domain protein